MADGASENGAGRPSLSNTFSGTLGGCSRIFSCGSAGPLNISTTIFPGADVGAANASSPNAWERRTPLGPKVGWATPRPKRGLSLFPRTLGALIARMASTSNQEGSLLEGLGDLLMVETVVVEWTRGGESETTHAERELFCR